MDLSETQLKKLCAVNKCKPRDVELDGLDLRKKRLTKADYADSLASKLSNEDILRQLPSDARKKLEYQISELKRKWKLDEYAEQQTSAVGQEDLVSLKTPPESQVEKPDNVKVVMDSSFDNVVSEICKFRPPRRFIEEREYEISLHSHLSGVFPKAITENQYKLGDTRCDIKIDNFAIEIKKSPTDQELRRLQEQISRYSKYPQFRKIIVVIFDADLQSTTNFCNTMAQTNILDRVTVIADYRTLMRDGRFV